MTESKRLPAPHNPVQYVMPIDTPAKTIEQEHREFIAKLSKPGASIVASLTPWRADFWSAATALLVRIGEMADPIKKYVIYEKPIDRYAAAMRLVRLAEAAGIKWEYNGDIVANLTPEKAHLWHMAFALMIEVAELSDPIHAHVTGNRELDRANALEELGDILYYFQSIVDFYGFTITQIREANMAKLRTRYPQGYSNAAAQARADKAAEEKVG